MTMILVLKCGGAKVPLLLYESSYVAKEIYDAAPFDGVVTLWKEEIYFEIPVEAEVRNPTLKVRRGDIAYWEPGHSFCVFYGLSQPYTPVEVIGEIIGPTSLFHALEGCEEVQVEKYKEEGEFQEELSALRSAGLVCAVKGFEDEGYWIAANVYAGKERVGFDIYVEDVGYMFESDGLYVLTREYNSLRAFKELKDLLQGEEKLRADVNEDGFVCISGFCEELSELPDLLKKAATIYLKYAETRLPL